MAGLREDKKQQTQVKIMESAKTVFSEKGFQKASMAEIARDAEVGTGTIYNYFASKGALLIRIFAEEVEQLQKTGDVQFAVQPEAGLVDTVIQLLQQFNGLFHSYPKAFWRDLIHAMTEEVEESIQLRQDLFGLDQQMMVLVMQMIEKESDRFRVPVNAEEAAYAIYGAVMMDTMLYIYNEPMTIEHFEQQMTRHIRFLFAGKMK